MSPEMQRLFDTIDRFDKTNPYPQTELLLLIGSRTRDLRDELSQMAEDADRYIRISNIVNE